MLQLQLYNNEVFDFLRTCTVKNTYFAEQIEKQTLIITNKPSIELWENPYYLHMNGLYSALDERMYVRSLDTHTDILFDRSILKDHHRTLSAYKVPNQKFLDLCDKYPHQTELIKSILYPALTQADEVLKTPREVHVTSVDAADAGADILLNRVVMLDHPDTLALYQSKGPEYDLLKLNYAGWGDYIDAALFPITESDYIVTCKNMTLVAYDDNLLHPNEQFNMVKAVEHWLQLVNIRWDVREFDYEEYYYPAFWTLVWYNLPLLLLKQRFLNIRTNHVHPFHIWEYLKSNGLNDYRDILNNTQEMFLYKNMEYLKKNGGKNSNLKILSDNLLSDYGVQLRTKSVVQRIDLASADPNNPGASVETCKTTPLIISEVLDRNTTALQNSEDGEETIATIVDREFDDKLEPFDNAEVVDEQTRILQNSKYTYMLTKLIELKRLDKDDSYLRLYYNFILHTTLMKYANGDLQYNLDIQLKDGEPIYSYSVGEIIALIYYSVSKSKTWKDGTSWKEEVDIIPTKLESYNAYKREFTDRPTTVTCRGSGMNPYKPITFNIESLMDVDTIYNSVPSRTTIDHTAEEMMNDMNGQFDVLTQHFNSMRGSGDYAKISAWRSLYDYMSYVGIIEFELVSGYTNFSDWIAAVPILRDRIQQIDNSGNSKVEYEDLSMRLVKALYPSDRASGIMAGGLTDHEYKQMKALFMQLCSYNIAFIDTNRAGSMYFFTALKGLLPANKNKTMTGIMTFPWWTTTCSPTITKTAIYDGVTIDSIKVTNNITNKKTLPYDIDIYDRSTYTGKVGVEKILDVEYRDDHTILSKVPLSNIQIAGINELHIHTTNDGSSAFIADIERPPTVVDVLWKFPDNTSVRTNHLNYNGFTTNENKEIRIDMARVEETTQFSIENGSLVNSIDLRYIPNLEQIHLANNNLTQMYAAGLESLQVLDVANNDLTELIINKHERLSYLGCDNNNLNEDALEEIVYRLHLIKDALGNNRCIIKLNGNTQPNALTITRIDELQYTGCIVTYDQ